MTAHTHYRNLLVLIAGLLISACASTPATSFYVLDPIKSHTSTPEKIGPKRLIGLGPVVLPALLERKQLVTRTGNNTIQIAELHQWAAPLKEGITQTLAENLRKLRNNYIIKAHPWSAYGEVDYRVLIEVTRFDATPGKSTDLEANWAIMAEQEHTILTNGQFQIHSPLADTTYSGGVTALSKALGEFSRRLAVELDEIK